MNNNNNLCSDESVSTNKKKRVIIKELVQGQEAATKLKLLLKNPFGSEGSLSSQELMANILRSFSETISIITSEISGQNGSPVAGAGNASNETKKRSQKGGRGCYNRSSTVVVHCFTRQTLLCVRDLDYWVWKEEALCVRTKSSQAWSILSNTTGDNYAWRKYGQKEILNSEFPRSYFRCSYKYDQDCGATKQVQRDEENPEMYRITYIGLHTCNASADSVDWESFLLNCEASETIEEKQYPKEETPSDVTDPTLVSLNMESHNNDAECMDMDFGVDSLQFCPHFPFAPSHHCP
ncbi:hypothetical protein RJT34_11913 [Clitoria ternatea]|uniref:WRKY domain-containing protein n=1 Tax=Clitoria ternatea TaxID=43366 RepID=A0AAN9JNE7_CLITE